MSKTLIYDPKLDYLRPRTSVAAPIEATSSPIRFPRALSRGLSKKGTLDTVETKGGWIHPGTNLNFSDEDYDHISKHPVGADLLSSGALKVVEVSIKEGEIITETTRDYLDKDALELIRNSSDAEWLERSERKEERPVILKALMEQLKALKALNARS